MNAGTKNEIRAALSRVAGHDVGEVEPRYFLSHTTPAPQCFPTMIGPAHCALMVAFLDRAEPFAVPRKIRALWTFSLN